MSGKPHPQGATRTIEIIGRMEAIRAESEALDSSIRVAQAKLQPLREEYAQLMSEFDKLIMSMDLHAPANAGYEGRMAWFLGEIYRQSQRLKSAARSKMETRIRALASNAKHWSDEAIDTAISEIFEIEAKTEQ